MRTVFVNVRSAVKRWVLGWLLFISAATGGAYLGGSVFAQTHPVEPDRTTLAMMPIVGGGPGTAVCQRATRTLVATTESGGSPTAAPELRAAWERAQRGVTLACREG
jgi:hypothetical protein